MVRPSRGRRSLLVLVDNLTSLQGHDANDRHAEDQQAERAPGPALDGRGVFDVREGRIQAVREYIDSLYLKESMIDPAEG